MALPAVAAVSDVEAFGGEKESMIFGETLLNQETNVSESDEAAPNEWDAEELMRNFTIEGDIYKYTSPALIAIGIPGNFLCAYLWLQRRLRTSSGVYLSALGDAEFCFLILFIIQYAERAFKARITTSFFMCKSFVTVFYFTQYLHPLLTAAYTIERWYAVTFPFKAYKICTIKVACIVIACLTAFSACVASVQLLFWQYSESKDLCDLRPEIFEDDHFLERFYTAFTWAIEMFFFAVIPVIVLVINLVVIILTRRVAKSDITKNVSRLQEGKSAQGSQAAATTVTLLILSFYFIFTTLPVSACSILSLEFPPGNSSLSLSREQIAEDPTWSSHFMFFTIRTVVDCFGLSQYCCAFYIYVATSRPFRKVALQALARWFPCIFRRVYQQIHRKDVLEMTGLTSNSSVKFVRRPGMTRSERDAEIAKGKELARAKAKALAEQSSEQNGFHSIAAKFKSRKRDKDGPRIRRELDEIRYSSIKSNAKLLPKK